MNSSSWLLLNLNVSGYFRVNYNQENWDQLLNQLSTNHEVHGAVRGQRVAPTPCAPLSADADFALSSRPSP